MMNPMGLPSSEAPTSYFGSSKNIKLFWDQPVLSFVCVGIKPKLANVYEIKCS